MNASWQVVAVVQYRENDGPPREAACHQSVFNPLARGNRPLKRVDAPLLLLDDGDQIGNHVLGLHGVGRPVAEAGEGRITAATSSAMSQCSGTSGVSM